MEQVHQKPRERNKSRHQGSPNGASSTSGGQPQQRPQHTYTAKPVRKNGFRARMWGLIKPKRRKFTYRAAVALFVSVAMVGGFIASRAFGIF